MACKLLQWHGNPSKLLCEMWLQHCKFSHHQQLWRKLNGFNHNATLIAPVLLTSFLMSTNLLLKLMISQQVWTALAPAPCLSWDRKREDRKYGHFPPDYLMKMLKSVGSLMHMRELYKLWMNGKILYQKCIKTVWNKGQLTPF